jgi:hypothetical protein
MTAAVVVRHFPDFSLRIAVIPFPTFDDYFLCKLMQRLCQRRGFFSQIAVDFTIPSDFAARRSRAAYSGINLASWY